MKKLLFFIIFMQVVLTTYLQAEKKVVYSAQTCFNSNDNQDKILFSSKEVKGIVLATGIDQRSLCNFIQLGSRVYPLKVLKAEIIQNKGVLKDFLNAHYIFPDDSQYFQSVADFLFSNRYSDSEQVLNSIILNDLLYGYEIGDTIPVYMQQFLFYAANNTSKKEKEAMNKIMPYILYLEGTLLGKTTFTSENTEKYIKIVQKETNAKIQKGNTIKSSSANSSVLQDSAF